MHRRFAVALAIVLAVPLSLFADERALGKGHLEIRGAPLGRLGAAQSDDVDVDEVDELQAYVDAMNRERLTRGEKPLRLNRALCAAANDRVRDMLEQHYFNHNAPDGTQPFVWVTREGYDYAEAGENLAVGYRGADRTVAGWMDSPGHRANILNQVFEDVGVAVASESPTQKFRGPLVVALYGAR